MKKHTKNTTFKTPLLNDCTNHIAFQLEEKNMAKKVVENNVSRLYETPISNVVTNEFIKGYN